MSDDNPYLPNAILMEISIDDDGRLVFSGGWSFDDDYPDDSVAFLQDILAGVYAIINTQTENVLAAGQIVRTAPGFDGFQPQEEEEFELVFEPDEELLNRVKDKDQPDLKIIKFDPKKYRKH